MYLEAVLQVTAMRLKLGQHVLSDTLLLIDSLCSS